MMNQLISMVKKNYKTILIVIGSFVALYFIILLATRKPQMPIEYKAAIDSLTKANAALAAEQKKLDSTITTYETKVNEVDIQIDNIKEKTTIVKEYHHEVIQQVNHYNDKQVDSFFKARYLYQMIGIYKITSPINKIYIGQSVNIIKRFNDYKILNNCKGQIKLYNSLVKYNPENHKFEIIEECSEEQLNEKEIYWGLKFDVLGLNGLNLKLGYANGKCSEETKQKISRSNKGKISYRKNKNLSQQHISNLQGIKKPGVSDFRKGKKLSEITKQNISNALKGKPKTKEHILNKAKSCSKPVQNIETGETYKSIKAAAESINKDTGIIHYYIKKKTWQYI